MSLPSSLHLRLAARTLRAGGLIAYPTEAVWGLGCDPFNAQAVLRLLAVKRRPMHKGVILIASSVKQVEPYLQLLTAEQYQQVTTSWPGPYTWVVPVPKDFPVWLRGAHDSVAIRVSAHAGVQALCETYGGPIVSTSANRSAQPPARSAWEIIKTFGGGIDYILSGQLGGQRQPTLIRDARTGDILRPSL